MLMTLRFAESRPRISPPPPGSRSGDEKFRSLIPDRPGERPVPLARGQEIVIASVGRHCARRLPGHHLPRPARPGSPYARRMREPWAEFFGKGHGHPWRGGGPMHITHPTRPDGDPPASSAAAPPIAQRPGPGRPANRLGRSTSVTVPLTSAFHEARNLASLWRLPVVFCCHNNHYAEHTRLEDGSARGPGGRSRCLYKMPGVRVDGNDLVAIRRGAYRRGTGPAGTADSLEASDLPVLAGHQMSGPERIHETW